MVDKRCKKGRNSKQEREKPTPGRPKKERRKDWGYQMEIQWWTKTHWYTVKHMFVSETAREQSLAAFIRSAVFRWRNLRRINP